MARTDRRRGWPLVAVAAAGTALAVDAGWRFWFDWEDRFGGEWTWAESIYIPFTAVCCVALALCGPWLSWRLPGNPTGRRLTLLGFAFNGWLAATFWHHRYGSLVSIFVIPVFRPLLFLAVLGWPTGHFEPAWRRRVRTLIILELAISAVLPFIGEGGSFRPSTDENGWPLFNLPQVGSDSLGQLTGSTHNNLLIAVVPVAVLVVAVRRQRQLRGVRRRSARFATAAVVAATVPDLWLTANTFLLEGIEWVDERATFLGFIRVTLDFGRFGAVPVLLVLASRTRSHELRALESRALVVDIGDAVSAADAASSVSELLGDPSARLLWWGEDGWLDADGLPAAADPTRAIEIADPRGALIAAIEHRPGLELAPSVVEAVAARLRLRIVQGREVAVAAARLAELRVAQRTFLDAQDDARVRAERDLHDGAQQRLVGLAIEIRLAARAELDGVAGELADDIDAAADELLATAQAGAPAAVADGLAGGLATLASTTPIPMRLDVSGDLDGASPLAATAWFIVNEAVANTLKHAHASALDVRVRVDGGVAIVVADNGLGGVTMAPRAIAERVASAGGEVEFVSPIGGGTTITVRLPTRVPETVA